MRKRQQDHRRTPSDAAYLRKQAEEIAEDVDPVSVSALTPEAIQQIIYELQVHQIELKMQNEELRTAQVEIEESRTRYFDLYDLAPVGYTTVSEKGLILEANLTAATLLGVYRGALIKQLFTRVIFKEDQDIYYLHRKKLFETGEPQSCELRLVKADGSLFWAHLTATVAQEANGVPECRVVFSDISERKDAESKLLYLSYHDHLTGIHNRRYFEQELKNLDTTENLPISIIMYDVNGLKMINDSFGHEAGDELLKKAAETVKIVCREEDIAARIGGDEFVLLLPKTTANESVEIANRVQEFASKEKVANIELSISYGYDTKTDEKQSIMEIVANAENYMYRHKLNERSSIKSKKVDLIMNALFEKSKIESAHSNRVSIICQAIASKMNMHKDTVNHMKIAGLIHDIGKIGINESILNKPGRLTIAERIDIERHPEIGWRLLNSTNEFSELAQFILNGHEKWDGSGYPNGLKGETIPLESRIIAVADAYDAMTRGRSHRKVLSNEEAIQELMRCSGKQFDSEIVNIFVNQVLSENNDFEGDNQNSLL